MGVVAVVKLGKYENGLSSIKLGSEHGERRPSMVLVVGGNGALVQSPRCPILQL